MPHLLRWMVVAAAACSTGHPPETGAIDAPPAAGDGASVDGAVADASAADAPAGGVDAPGGVDAREADAATSHPASYCAYFLTGEIDLVGTDADGDGAPNGWDHCPSNPTEWQDSDRDGVGNHADPDLDGDGVPNTADADRDDDGSPDAAEAGAGTDPADPTSVPGLRRFDLDLGVLNAQPGWYRGDFHVHVEYSHDSDAPLGPYIPAAQSRGLDFLVITDHDVFEAPFDPAWNQPGFLLIPGLEWGGGGGHANMFGLRTLNDTVSDAPADIRTSWHQARMQGAVQSLNHYGAQQDRWDATFAAAPDLYDALDVIEVWNHWWIFNSATNEPSIALWQRLLNQGHHIGAIGGGDSHTETITLGQPTTVVYARSLSVPGILDGVRRGRTYLTQGDPFTLANPPALDFRIDADGDGSFEAMLGDQVAAGPLAVRVAVTHAKGPIVLFRNGVELTRWSGHAVDADVVYTATDVAPAGAWYRVEMREDASPWSAMRLFSSAIYVAAAP